MKCFSDMKMAAAVTALGLFLLCPGTLLAVDHRNLEENHPTRIEDAYPISFRSMEVQGRLGYQNEGEYGTHSGEMEMEFKWGFWRNAHVVLGVPLNFSDEVDTGSNGDVRVEALYNLNVERKYLPAFAIKTDFLFPGGADSRGVDTELIAIATKGWGQHRFHLNSIWRHNGGRGPGEREHAYTVGAGYDFPLDLDTLFTADFFVEQSELSQEDDPIHSFVVGGRKQINPWSVLTFGVGHAFGQTRAPDFFSTLGFQINF